MSQADILFLLKKHGIRPDEEKGQNFLTDDTALKKIAAAAKNSGATTAFEIGAGIGNLTALLAASFDKVIAIEIDTKFRPLLDRLVSVNKNLRVVYDDVLKAWESTMSLLGSEGRPYVVVGNIPYYLTSHIIERLLSSKVSPAAIVLLLQKEVAERIVADPGDHSKLSLSVQYFGNPKILFTVPKASFYPVPQVDSAVLTISNIRPWPYDVPEKDVWRIIAFGFSAKRKKLANNLAAGLHKERDEVLAAMKSCGLNENARAQELAKENWVDLFRSLQKAL